MTEAVDFLSRVSTILTGFGIFILALFATIVSRKIFRQQSILRDSLQPLESREFHSSIAEWRIGLEKQLADINERLTDRSEEFNEVNHLLLDAETARKPSSPGTMIVHSPFLAAMDIPPIPVEDGLIFVLTPFEKREQTTYSAIVEAFENWDVRVLRGDEEHVANNILRHIVTMISQARIVIANISSRNPNVMYELGIAHALGKTVIMVAKSIDQVPFDLSHQRILLYTNRSDLVSKLRDSVGRTLISEKSTGKGRRQPIGIVAKTGDVCPESGVWVTVSSSSVSAPIAKGNIMPPYNGAPATWKLTRYA